MHSTPSVLSMGMRCMEQNFGFVWMPGKSPCVITPHRNIIVLDVENHVPNVKAGSLQLNSGDDAKAVTIELVTVHSTID